MWDREYDRKDVLILNFIALYSESHEGENMREVLEDDLGMSERELDYYCIDIPEEDMPVWCVYE